MHVSHPCALLGTGAVTIESPPRRKPTPRHSPPLLVTPNPTGTPPRDRTTQGATRWKARPDTRRNAAGDDSPVLGEHVTGQPPAPQPLLEVPRPLAASGSQALRICVGFPVDRSLALLRDGEVDQRLLRRGTRRGSIKGMGRTAAPLLSTRTPRLALRGPHLGGFAFASPVLRAPTRPGHAFPSRWETCTPSDDVCRGLRPLWGVP